MLELDELVMDFGGFRAVNGCSFRVGEGSITGLIGPNGAGKTTLFNLIAGALQPTSGRIRFLGEDVTPLASHQLFHKGLVRTFQIPHEFHKLTTLENLMMVPPSQPGENLLSNWIAWGRVSAAERAVEKKAYETLEFLELTHVAHERAGNLSGGQKKLLELGRTMMTNAKLVLLDEPAAGMTDAETAETARLLKEIAKDHSVVVVEHDMDFVRDLGVKVTVLHEGRVLAEGSLDQVSANQEVIDVYLGR